MRGSKRHLNLHQRVLLALVAIVTVLVGAQGALAYLSFADQENYLADKWVLAQARRLSAYAERGDLHGPRAAELFHLTPALSAWLLDEHGEAFPGPVPPYLSALGEGAHRLKREGDPLHVVVLKTGQGRLYVQYDARSNEDEVDQFGIYLLGLAAFCGVLALIAARWIAAIVVAPIEQVTQQLTNWAPDTSIKQAASDEEERLLDAFRRVQSRFEEAVAREREFVANVRHEIRTPLTALRTDIELLAIAEKTDAAKRARLQRALSMVDLVNASVESARMLSQRQVTTSQEIDLARCIDDAWASLEGHPGIDRLRFVNAVAPGTAVSADRHSLLTILRNLIRNSAEHAAPAQCKVSYEDRSIEVADDGPGIGSEDLAFVFERYYRGRLKDSPGVEAGEHGLGLAIARQVADLNGWTLTARSESGRGARFILRLS